METAPPAPSRTFSLRGLRLDTRATLILVCATLLLLIDHYHRFLPGETFAQLARAKAFERIGYYLLVPLGIILLALRERPADYGFRLGDWRAGIRWTGIIIVAAALVLYLPARSPAMIQYYSRFPGSLREIIVTGALDLVGWEFFFRGFLLFGLMRLAGPTAVVLQAVPFALAHMGKPEVETLSTIFGGTLFGWVAWRTRSFIYPFLIHLFVYTWVVWVAQA